jgi:two-component system sensor histidine kinase KdpD
LLVAPLPIMIESMNDDRPRPSLQRRIFRPPRDARIGVPFTIAGTAVLVSLMAPFQDEIGTLNEGLVLLALTLVVSATWGLRVGLFAALLTNLALNFFFIPPLHEFTVQDPHNAFGLFVFLGVSIVGGSLLSRARTAAELAHRRQAETEIVLQLSRDLIGRTDPTDALTALCDNIVRAMGAPGAAVLSRVGSQWTVLASTGSAEAGRGVDTNERVIAEHAVESGRVASRGHTGIGSSRTRRVVMPSGGGRGRVAEMTAGTAFAPLNVGDRQLGVLRLDGPIENPVFRDHPEELLDAFAREAALGVQRVELAREASHAEALREADEMKTALMTSISHDLKTPLAGITASVSSLLDNSVEWTDEDRASFLETIESQADRLNRVISDILDLNRIEAGVVKATLSDVGVRNLLNEAAERTRLATASRAVGVVAPDELSVRADRSLILQALVNLIENAAKYSTPHGAIRLRAAPVGAEVSIVVEDEGPGIAPQDLPHVFERFYRAEEQSRRVKGSGLGLAIVKGFVTLSGGTVRVESSPKGTRFVISLPIAARVGVA